jgi:hypothetical protein
LDGISKQVLKERFHDCGTSIECREFSKEVSVDIIGRCVTFTCSVSSRCAQNCSITEKNLIESGHIILTIGNISVIIIVTGSSHFGGASVKVFTKGSSFKALQKLIKEIKIQVN